MVTLVPTPVRPGASGVVDAEDPRQAPPAAVGPYRLLRRERVHRDVWGVGRYAPARRRVDARRERGREEL
eukprot:862508-Pyramimonas_sp.AAC.1